MATRKDYVKKIIVTCICHSIRQSKSFGSFDIWDIEAVVCHRIRSKVSPQFENKSMSRVTAVLNAANTLSR